MLLEDRIDDLIARYPEMRFTRSQLTSWLEIDPSRNKKYFAWIVKQIADKKLKPSTDGEQLRDDLMAFERFLAIPEFRESRDIQQYDRATLKATIRKYSGLQSKTQKEREARAAGAKLLNRVTTKKGNYELYEITNTQELMNRAWSGYSAQNPNWKYAPMTPPRPGHEEEEDWDGFWCVRFPRYASSYLNDGAFYMVYKNGGVYVGIVWERGECQSLKNQGITLGVAEEIYPLIKDFMPSTLKGNCSVFANLKFLRGEVKPGEVVEPGHHGILNLSGSSLSALPDNLTIKGSLDISNTQMTQLPKGLTVTRSLAIQGTRISALPDDLKVEEMTWSEPLTYEDTLKLYFRNKLPEMKAHYFEKNAEKPQDEVQRRWENFVPSLLNHWIQDPRGDIRKNVQILYRHVTAN